MATFTLTNPKLSISYPSSWEIFDNPLKFDNGILQIMAIQIAGRSFPAVRIVVLPFDVLYDEKGVFDEDIVTLPGYEKIETKSFETGYIYGNILEFHWETDTYIFGKKITQCKRYSTKNALQIILFTFCAEEKHWPVLNDVIQKMVDSIQFKD